MGVLFEALTLVGLCVNRRLRRAWTLPPWLLSLIGSAAVVGVCPACNTWDFWLVKEFVHAALALLLGVELAARISQNLPRARQAARRWIVFVLVMMVVLVVTAPEGPLTVNVLPRLLASIAWLYTGLVVVTIRFVLPLDPLHRAVLLGLSPYMMLYAATWGHAAADTSVPNLVNPAMFILALVVLLRAAWLREKTPAAPREVVRFLWPWT
jgi:hypothetical protein